MKFDVTLIEKYSLKYFNYPILNYKLDFFSLYKSSSRKVGSLGDIARELGSSIKGRHASLNDVYITALALLNLLKGYEGKKVWSLPLFV